MLNTTYFCRRYGATRTWSRLAYNGGCRNDGFSSLDSLYVLLGIVVNGIVIPILKAVFEATVRTSTRGGFGSRIMMLQNLRRLRSSVP